MKRFVRRVLLVTLVGVLVYGAFVAYAGYRDIRQSLSGFGWWSFAAALGLASLNYLLRFLKWEYYLARLEIRGVPKWESLLIFLSGFVLTVTPGKVGEVFKSAVLYETHGVAASRTAPIVVAERLTDVIAVIVLIALGSAGFSGGMAWAAAGTGAVAVGMVFILWRKPVSAVLDVLERRPGRLGRLAPKLREAFDSLRMLASPVALLWPTVLSIIGWGCEGIALALLLRGFGTEVPISLAVFFYATATLAGALVPLPGGLGVVEGLIHEQLVRLASTPAAVAAAAMILVRFATLWWAVIVGFAALGALRLRYPDLLGERMPRVDQSDTVRLDEAG